MPRVVRPGSEWRAVELVTLLLIVSPSLQSCFQVPSHIHDSWLLVY